MKVYVTGGTGFVGRAVLRELLARGVSVRALVRSGSERKLGKLLSRVEVVSGSVEDEDAHAKGLEGCASAIHLVGIIREFPSRGITYQRLHVQAVASLVSALQDRGVKRLIHMSAQGARADAPARYHQSKWMGERLVRYSGLDWTLFRPSVILGPEGEFSQRLMAWAKRGIVPAPGGGKTRFQPIDADSVARALADAALEQGDRFIGKTYEVGGEEEITFRGLVSEMARLAGSRPPRFVSLPFFLLKSAAFLFQGWNSFPLTLDQIALMQEENPKMDLKAFQTDFGITPVSLEQWLGPCLRGI